MRMKAFVSWSGGKDSGLALLKAGEQSIDVCSLLNMTSETGTRSRSHGLSNRIMSAQAECLRLPLYRAAASWAEYEKVFKDAVRSMVSRLGITAGVFGDIDIPEHRQWVERVCGELEIEPVLPLWHRERTDLMETLLDEKFEAVVVTTRAARMGEEWLGKTMDRELISRLKKERDIDLCGEQGEYHTLLCDGPMFRKRIVPTDTEKIKIDQHWFLDIKDFFLEDKR